jgi:NADH-ubiquinone oxidoreductase chain 6
MRVLVCRLVYDAHKFLVFKEWVWFSNLQMFTCFITMLTLSFGVSLIITFYPLTLGFWILVLSIIISILISTTFSRWFGFIIFLIYIGGMLVIFAYFVAIQPNQHFRLKVPFFFLILSFINLPINIYPILLNLFSESRWWIRSLFFINNIIVLIMLALVLFLALVIVVKITRIYIAALRPFS